VRGFWVPKDILCCHDQPLNRHAGHGSGTEELLEVFSPMTWYDAGAGALCTARIHDIYSA